jgi:predicted RNA-binding protein YlxR (DUF448 family)
MPKGALLRLVAGADGLEPDPEARRPGRGVYLCSDPECIERARRRRGFERSLRAPVTLAGDSLESVRRWQRSASTR